MFLHVKTLCPVKFLSTRSTLGIYWTTAYYVKWVDNIKYGRERQSNDVFADESGHAMNIPEKSYCLQNGMLILSKTPQVQLHVVCVVRGVYWLL